MILWSLQPLDVYQSIIETGFYHCKPELSKCIQELNFTAAYDWLVDQMKKRIGPPPPNVKYPVWAWHTTYWKHKKPDLRRSEFRDNNTPMVCLEIEKPDDQVLLSDEENWYDVLGNWYFSETEAEHNRFETLPFDEQEILKKQSWEKVFLVDPFENKWYRRGMFIQATFWELKKDDIRKVLYYGNKKSI